MLMRTVGSVMVLLVAVALTACGGHGEPTLVGEWQMEGEENARYAFYSDGTGYLMNPAPDLGDPDARSVNSFRYQAESDSTILISEVEWRYEWNPTLAEGGTPQRRLQWYPIPTQTEDVTGVGPTWLTGEWFDTHGLQDGMAPPTSVVTVFDGNDLLTSHPGTPAEYRSRWIRTR
jgi:hypothetical protein